MKQHISSEQLNEYLELKIENGIANLNFEKQGKLNKFLGIESDRNYPPAHLITIGTMIDILKQKYWITLEQDQDENNSWHVVLYEKEKNTLYHQFHVAKKELVDALWKAVKETL